MQRVHGFLQAPAFFPSHSKAICSYYECLSPSFFDVRPGHCNALAAGGLRAVPHSSQRKNSGRLRHHRRGGHHRFCRALEVFKDVFVQDRGKTMAEQAAFRLYTVSDSREPVTTSGGMRIIPDYTFDDAPAPAIVVVPAQRGRSPRCSRGYAR